MSRDPWYCMVAPGAQHVRAPGRRAPNWCYCCLADMPDSVPTPPAPASSEKASVESSACRVGVEGAETP